MWEPSQEGETTGSPVTIPIGTELKGGTYDKNRNNFRAKRGWASLRSKKIGNCLCRPSKHAVVLSLRNAPSASRA